MRVSLGFHASTPSPVRGHQFAADRQAAPIAQGFQAVSGSPSAKTDASPALLTALRFDPEIVRQIVRDSSANRACPTRSATRASSRPWPSWSAHVEHVTTHSSTTSPRAYAEHGRMRGRLVAALE